jgi:hypothetical protein
MMVHAEAHDLSFLAAGADQPATAIVQGVAGRGPLALFPAGSGG